MGGILLLMMGFDFDFGGTDRSAQVIGTHIDRFVE
jgi:hypothetical protein